VSHSPTNVYETTATAAADLEGPLLDLLPRLGLGDLLRVGARAETVLRGRPYVPLLSGRAALYLALRQAGVARGDQVLLPAYHCPSMIEPVRWLDAEPTLYRMQPNLAPDLRDLEAKLTPRVKAVVAAHLFGFVTDLAPVRRVCDERRACLIEDCAHALFAPTPVGTYGEFVVTSPRKFFPIYDGGALAARTADRLPRAASPTLRFQLQAVWNAVRPARSHHAPGSSTSARQSAEPSVAAEYRDTRFDRAAAHRRMSAFSRAVAAASASQRVIEKRRSNYRTLARLLAGVKGTEPLIAEPAEGVAPYVLPLLVTGGTPVYMRLRAAGIRLGRWDQIVLGVCPVATRYAETLLHLPCHQGLTPDELRQLASAVARAVEK
jgi:dTDP-4-amino-4,6-dideoxygalactose transaminase